MWDVVVLYGLQIVLSQGHAVGKLTTPALLPFSVPSQHQWGQGWKLPLASGPPGCQLFLLSEKHHLQLLSGADWIKALTLKGLIGAQVKWRGGF